MSKIDLNMVIPKVLYRRIAPRFGLSINNFIDVGVGVVDSDFRAVIKVILIKHSSLSNLG